MKVYKSKRRFMPGRWVARYIRGTLMYERIRKKNGKRSFWWVRFEWEDDVD